MPILVTEDEIEHLKSFDSIPIVCVQCGVQMSLRQPSKQVLYALYNATSLQRSKHKLVMLQRTQALFDSFPASRHYLKLRIEHLDRKDFVKSGAERTEKDVELEDAFQKALDADPELKKFLRNSFFWLQGRLESVKEIIEREEQQGRARLKCTDCAEGHFCIEPTFAQRVLL